VILRGKNTPRACVYVGKSFKLGLERKFRGFGKGFGPYLPAFSIIKNKYQMSHPRSLSVGRKCSGGLVPFNGAIFGGRKVIQTRVGYFNKDKLFDVAYTVIDPKRGPMSCIFCREPLHRCATVKADVHLKSAWYGLSKLTSFYLKKGKSISPSLFKVFRKLAKVYVRERERSGFSAVATTFGTLEILPYHLIGDRAEMEALFS